MNFFKKKEFKIVFLGLDETGKSSLLFQLKMGSGTAISSPTIGFFLECIEYKGYKFFIWDVGGQDKMRVLWKHYFPSVDAFCFIVDSNNRDNIEDSAKEMKEIIEDEATKNKPILIIANKQDLDTSLPPDEVSEIMDVKQIKEREYKVIGTSSKTGEGIPEVLDWLFLVLAKKKKQNVQKLENENIKKIKKIEIKDKLYFLQKYLNY